MYDYGMRAATIRICSPTCANSSGRLCEAITRQLPADDRCVHQAYPEAQQLTFGEEIVKRYGYDFKRGRQDKTHHPFCTKFSLGDVRITTRVKENDLTDALFSTLHEAGHALYEQGICRDYEALPLGTGTSAGRARKPVTPVGKPWSAAADLSGITTSPSCSAAFPVQLGHVPQDEFYRAINKVQRSLSAPTPTR